jgi:hypothetical protein
MKRSPFIRCLLLTTIPLLCVAPFAAESIGATPPASFDHLEQLFKNPPNDSRIMMRWWWFGPAVQKQELEREMRTMREGGIGGVEVQAVYPLALDDAEHGLRNLPYLSDEFMDSLRFASKTARDLGLRFDLTLGSGWPYGGPAVPVNEAAGYLRTVKINVESSQTVPLPDITRGEQFVAAFVRRASSPPGAWIEITDVYEHLISLPVWQRPRQQSSRQRQRPAWIRSDGGTAWNL